MRKGQASKLIPNLLSTQLSQYPKLQHVQQSIKQRAKPITRPQKSSHPLPSMQNCTKPTEIQVQPSADHIIEEQENVDPHQARGSRANTQENIRIIDAVKEQLQPGDRHEESDCLSSVNKLAVSRYEIDGGKEERKGDQPSPSMKKSKKKRTLEEIIDSRKLKILKRHDRKKKNLFNLDIESSSDNQAERMEQLEQKKSENFHLARGISSHSNETQSLLDPKKSTSQINKFDIDFSECQSENEKQQQPVPKVPTPTQLTQGSTGKIAPKVQQSPPPPSLPTSQNPPSCKKMPPSPPPPQQQNPFLQIFNIKSPQMLQKNEQDQQSQSQSPSEYTTPPTQNLNIEKLESHFTSNPQNQSEGGQKNFYAFCPIPSEHKISLIVKRNSAKSQYLIFDNQLVCQVIRVQKSIGGVYRFVDVPTGRDLGKMKANFMGTQFHFYAYRGEDAHRHQKFQCGSIVYDVNILGFNGPRRIKMLSPSSPLPLSQSILQIHSSSTSNSAPPSIIRTYQNKTPQYIPEMKAYVMNLRGCASHSSIKNCILVDSEDQEQEYLIFGKKAKDIFNLQIRYPFTVFQGVAFAVSSFEKKLGCQ